MGIKGKIWALESDRVRTIPPQTVTNNHITHDVESTRELQLEVSAWASAQALGDDRVGPCVVFAHSLGVSVRVCECVFVLSCLVSSRLVSPTLVSSRLVSFRVNFLRFAFVA